MPYDSYCPNYPDGPSDPVSAELRNLGPRQRQIAAIVYENGVATPREIQARLSERRSVRVIRTLLDRMVMKGLLKRRPSGRHNEVIYVAAIATPSVKEAALKRLIDERFGRSVKDAAAVVAAMTRKAPRVPRTSAAAMRLANEWVGSSTQKISVSSI